MRASRDAARTYGEARKARGATPKKLRNRWSHNSRGANWRDQGPAGGVNGHLNGLKKDKNKAPPFSPHGFDEPNRKRKAAESWTQQMRGDERRGGRGAERRRATQRLERDESRATDENRRPKKGTGLNRRIAPQATTTSSARDVYERRGE